MKKNTRMKHSPEFKASPLDALGDGSVDVAQAASARATLRRRKTGRPPNGAGPSKTEGTHPAR